MGERMSFQYMRIKDLMERYSISRSMVNKIIEEMIESKRYPSAAIIGTNYCRRIDANAFQDYFENMSWLRHPNMKKYVKPYRGGCANV